MADTPTAAAAAPDPTATATPGVGQSLLDLADSVIRTNTGKGAAMGGLLGYLLSQYGTAGGTNLGVDMSKAAGITPRSTTVAPSRYIPYAEYGARDSNAGMTPQLAHAFGVPTGLAGTSLRPVSSYDATPLRQTLPSKTITSAGSGSGVLQNPYMTPKTNAEISPLTGALMGAAIGYLKAPSAAAGTAAGAAGSGSPSTAFSNVLRAINQQSGSGSSTGLPPSNPNAPNYDATGWKYDASGNQVYVRDGQVIDVNPDGSGTGQPIGTYNPPSQDTGFASNIGKYDNYAILNDYNNANPPADNSNPLNVDLSYGQDYFPSASSWGDWKDGGEVMATPMMADGGQVPSYYTYGTPIDPKQIMQNMAQGGEPKNNLPTHVPTVEGRHDYRAGSRVTGEGDGQSDDIPAMLADGEYVFDSDTVAQLGNGSTKAGSDLLDRFREEIRSHKRSAPVNKIPPPAKSPLAYLKAARSKKNG